ncbi:MAG: Glucosaminyl phosphatidylinositol (GlcN-PI) nositol acylation protein [Alectoria fallacina]|uniref:GPI-anchored wall transfer protein n=1 Tax=Alectoria fallacina TaxID=1903189 RepID=A0A8H3EPJ3_9LECA|nr:MAG: Glucosaminyl phosphatidylinositol (GlcN-PI) nositol acylation protein [Alectoria fallacina]
MAQSYKTLKENFVSNLSGGTVSEINWVTAVAPAAYLTWAALQSRQGYFLNYTLPAFLADFLLNVGGILLAVTMYSSKAVLLNALLVSPAALLYVLPSTIGYRKRPSKPPAKEAVESTGAKGELEPLPRRPFITIYRGAMIVVTCLAILAVDFKIFPRRFAKVETWGTSLMDVGVGSFVFSAGLVSARPILQARFAGKTSAFGSQLKSAFRVSLPLLVLGVIRLYSVKGLDYAEHVTEYGVHWNFFFTLALLPPFVALLQSVSAVIPYTGLVSILIGGLYQTILELTRLKAFILTAPRTDLLRQNREGVFSFLGYLAIFLAGQALGFDVLPRNPSQIPTRESGSQQRKRLLIRLAAWSAVWVLIFYSVTSHNIGFAFQVSRRLANQPYILWVSAFNCVQIMVFCLVETLFFPGVYMAADRISERRECEKATSRVLKAFNRNGLAVFLLANLLTGLVNLTLDTLSMSQIGAIGVLVGYAALLTGVAVALDAWNLSIKL